MIDGSDWYPSIAALLTRRESAELENTAKCLKSWRAIQNKTTNSYVIEIAVHSLLALGRTTVPRSQIDHT